MDNVLNNEDVVEINEQRPIPEQAIVSGSQPFGALLQSLGLGVQNQPIIVIVGHPTPQAPIHITNYASNWTDVDQENSPDTENTTAVTNVGETENTIQAHQNQEQNQEQEAVQNQGNRGSWLIGLGIVAGGILGSVLRGFILNQGPQGQQNRQQNNGRRIRFSLGSLEIDQK